MIMPTVAPEGSRGRLSARQRYGSLLADLRKPIARIAHRLARPLVASKGARGGRDRSVRVSGNFQSNSSEAVRAATLSGIGIALSPIGVFGDDLRARRLKVVLADYQPKPLAIHAVSPANRRYSAKVNAFVNFFKAEFDLDPFVSGDQAWPMQVVQRCSAAACEERWFTRSGAASASLARLSVNPIAGVRRFRISRSMA